MHSSGNLFQSFTTLWENVYFLISNLEWLFTKARLCPLVMLSFFILKNISLFNPNATTSRITAYWRRPLLVWGVEANRNGQTSVYRTARRRENYNHNYKHCESQNIWLAIITGDLLSWSIQRQLTYRGRSIPLAPPPPPPPIFISRSLHLYHSHDLRLSLCLLLSVSPCSHPSFPTPPSPIPPLPPPPPLSHAVNIFPPLSLPPSNPPSLNPSIPQSLHPFIPSSLHPSIPPSLHPSIPPSLHPSLDQIHRRTITFSYFKTNINYNQYEGGGTPLLHGRHRLISAVTSIHSDRERRHTSVRCTLNIHINDDELVGVPSAIGSHFVGGC